MLIRQLPHPAPPNECSGDKQHHYHLASPSLPCLDVPCNPFRLTGACYQAPRLIATDANMHRPVTFGETGTNLQISPNRQVTSHAVALPHNETVLGRCESQIVAGIAETSRSRHSSKATPRDLKRPIRTMLAAGCTIAAGVHHRQPGGGLTHVRALWTLWPRTELRSTVAKTIFPNVIHAERCTRVSWISPGDRALSMSLRRPPL